MPQNRKATSQCLQVTSSARFLWAQLAHLQGGYSNGRKNIHSATLVLGLNCSLNCLDLRSSEAILSARARAVSRGMAPKHTHWLCNIRVQWQNMGAIPNYSMMFTQDRMGWLPNTWHRPICTAQWIQLRLSSIGRGRCLAQAHQDLTLHSFHLLATCDVIGPDRGQLGLTTGCVSSYSNANVSDSLGKNLIPLISLSHTFPILIAFLAWYPR